TCIGNGFRDAQHGELQHVEPIIGHGITSFSHQSLALPWEAEPKAAIVVFTFQEADGSDHLLGISFQAKCPGPFVAAFDRGKGDITIVCIAALWWIRPRNGYCKI